MDRWTEKVTYVCTVWCGEWTDPSVTVDYAIKVGCRFASRDTFPVSHPPPPAYSKVGLWNKILVALVPPHPTGNC